MIIDFDANEKIALPDTELFLQTITFKTCKSSNLDITHVLSCKEGDHHPEQGVYTKSWWKIRCCGGDEVVPDRYFQIFDGATSLYSVVRNYGFIDGLECVHHGPCTLSYNEVLKNDKHPNHALMKSMSDIRGVPQFCKQSGNCWFAALCAILCANTHAKKFLLPFVPEYIHDLLERCLFDEKKAIGLRRELWDEYKIGDNVYMHPLNDGSNGATELTRLCYYLEIPLVVYLYRNKRIYRDNNACSLPTPPPTQHYLILRFNGADSAHAPIHKSLTINDKRYELLGIFNGSKKCGHQIAMVCVSNEFEENSSKKNFDWIICDADAHFKGIGPMGFSLGNDLKKKWWTVCRLVVSITKFGVNKSKFCPLTPWNVSNEKYDNGSSSVIGVGTNSVDAVYISKAQ